MSADEKELGVVPLGRDARSDERHTPLPWTAEVGGRGSWIGNSGNWSALSCGNSNEEASANAAFIVLSANAHHGLVEALEKTLAALQESIEHIGLVRMQRGFSIEPIRERAGDAIESACTALSLLSTKGI